VSEGAGIDTLLARPPGSAAGAIEAPAFTLRWSAAGAWLTPRGADPVDLAASGSLRLSRGRVLAPPRLSGWLLRGASVELVDALVVEIDLHSGESYTLSAPAPPEALSGLTWRDAAGPTRDLGEVLDFLRRADDVSVVLCPLQQPPPPAPPAELLRADPRLRWLALGLALSLAALLVGASTRSLGVGPPPLIGVPHSSGFFVHLLSCVTAGYPLWAFGLLGYDAGWLDRIGALLHAPMDRHMARLKRGPAPRGWASPLLHLLTLPLGVLASLPLLLIILLHYTLTNLGLLSWLLLPFAGGWLACTVPLVMASLFLAWRRVLPPRGALRRSAALGLCYSLVIALAPSVPLSLPLVFWLSPLAVFAWPRLERALQAATVGCVIDGYGVRLAHALSPERRAPWSDPEAAEALLAAPGLTRVVPEAARARVRRGEEVAGREG